MQLINTIFLFGLFALSIPIIIHLIKQKKVQKVSLGSFRFLLEAQRSQRRRKNLKEWLLLALRLLIVLLLVSLFLRPYWGTNQDFDKDDSVTVLLIDVSGSMTGTYNKQSMFDAGKKKASELVKELGENTNLILAAFADDVEEIENLEDLTVVAGAGTNYQKAIAWAHNRLLASPKKHMDVVLISDLQVSGLPDELETEWSELINFYVHPILSVGKNNSGIQLNQTPEVFAGKTAHFYPENVVPEIEGSDNDIQLYINNELVNSSTNGFHEGLKWKPQQAGWFDAEIRLKNTDSWQFDNRYFFRVYANTLKSVLLVNGYKGKSRFTDADYFVKKALEVDVDHASKMLDLKEKNKFSETTDDLVVFCDVPGFSNQEIDNYIKYINDGGNALFFLGDRIDDSQLNSLFDKGYFPSKLERLKDCNNRPLLNWDKDHKAFQLFNNSNNGNILSIVFRESLKLVPHHDAKVLASLNNDNPAIVEMECGKGKVIVVANAANRKWTDWPVSRMFLPVVRELSLYLTGSMKHVDDQEELIQSIYLGEALGINRDTKKVINYNEQESQIEVTDKSSFLKALQIKEPQTDIIEEKLSDSGLSQKRQHENELINWIALLLLIALLAEVFTSYNLK